MFGMFLNSVIFVFVSQNKLKRSLFRVEEQLGPQKHAQKDIKKKNPKKLTSPDFGSAAKYYTKS
jgi:hypothetical protein